MSNEINARLTKYRRLKGYKKTEISAALGMKYTTYCNLEKNSNITGEFLLKAADLLKIDVRKLLYDEIPKTYEEPDEGDNPNTEKEPEEKQPYICYKFENVTIPVMEMNILKLIRRLSLDDLEIILDIMLKK